MNRAKCLTMSAIAVVSVVALAACSNVDTDKSAGETDTTLSKNVPEVSFKPDPEFSDSVSKPGAPFSISYRIIGTPIVGSPVTVGLRVVSALGPRPVSLRYRINDAAAMVFPEAQLAAVKVEPVANEDFVTQQVTVVPQREGRLYLNVDASFETEDGSMSTAVAIPIQVGSGGREIEEHGEVQLDENGEAVRVLTPQ